MNVACSSTTFGLFLASDMVENGSSQTAAVCSPEIMSGHLNFKCRATHFIFGDASATIIVSREIPDGIDTPVFEIVAKKVWTSFSSNIRSNFGFLNRTHPDTMFASDKLVTQQGRAVFKDITAKAADFIRDFVEENNVSLGEIERFWLHQANIKMLKAIVQRLLNKDMGIETPTILQDLGNVASPGSLIAFHRTRSQVSVGEYGLICSFGAGYSIGGFLVRRVR